MRTPILAVILCASLASAETEPAPRNWTVGAGFGFTWAPSLIAVSLGSGQTGLGALSSFGAVQPTTSGLVERRLGERTFLLVQLSVGYGNSQNTAAPSNAQRQFSIDGQLGVRHIFNPHGVVEISWFGTARGGWQTADLEFDTQSIDPNTGVLIPDHLSVRARAFSVGASTGLVLERELLDGLALRFSSSLVGFSYATSSFESVGNFALQPGGSRGVDVGLRFSPTIELRYAF